MNILILVSSLEIGGAQKQAVLDANMLATSQNVYFGMFASGGLADQLDDNIQTITFHKDNYWSTAGRIAKFVKEHNIQIIHNHLYAPMLISALASLKAPVPVLWHFHGHHFEVRRWPLNVLSQLPTVKKLIFVCSALANYFEQHYRFPRSKFEIVYNSSQSTQQPSLKSADQPLIIGFVGRLVGLKRVEYLIHLAAFLRDQSFSSFEIWVAGDGPERAELEALTQAQDVTEQVKFLGFRTDLEYLYNQMDIFILPSQEEALSLALIDASNCGIPCLCFDVGGNKEIVLDGKTGYVVHSEEALQQKTLQLCQDADLRHTLGQQAEQHAQIFSEESHLQRLLGMYQELV